MKINVDVHNYMETLVGAQLSEVEFVDKYSNEQLADLACLALNQLRPLYIRYDIDFLSRLPEERLIHLRNQAAIAIEAAETMIKEDRRSDAERYADDMGVPAVNPPEDTDEDKELEWYETPILGKKLKNK